MKTSVFKCPYCGSIFIGSIRDYLVKCSLCGVAMIKLDDDFDLTEIIHCETENGSVEQA